MDDSSNSLDALLSRHGLSRLSRPLKACALPALRIVRRLPEERTPGTSRLGGLPDLPPDFVWPERNGRPLSFIAQFNCAEIPEPFRGHELPASGILHFFYDTGDQPWGYDPAHKGSSAVVYTPAGPVAPAPMPSPDHGPDCILPPVSIQFLPCLSIPCFVSDAYRSLALGEEESKAFDRFYEDLLKENGGLAPVHQLLGHSYNVQGDMALECQLVTNGLYCGDRTGYEDPRADELAPGAADWRLLLQIDSDDDLDLLWGDSGMLYFWIRGEDLRKRRFENVWTVLQCM